MNKIIIFSLFLLVVGSTSFWLVLNSTKSTTDSSISSSSSTSITVLSESQSSVSKLTEAKLNKSSSTQKSIESISSLDLDIVFSSSSISSISKKNIPANMVEVKTKDSKIYDTCKKSEGVELGYTEDSCFRLKFDSNSIFKKEVDSDNPNLINNSAENKEMLVDLASDYYAKIEKKVKSRTEPVVISNATKKADFQFEFDLQVESKCKSKYLLFLNNGQWDYKNINIDLVNCTF
jgi:hypothetical protein